MAADVLSPFGMTNTPGSNFGGTNAAVPSSASGASASVGSTSNPLLPSMPTGQNMPNVPMPSFGVPAGQQTNLGAGSGAGGGASSLGFGGVSESSFVKSMVNVGYSSADAKLMYQFLKSGAGFNPQIAQSLVNAMQPYVQRGEADILEQFSNLGLRYGSPAAIGMGDFLGQVNLNEQQVFAQMEEKSIENYLQILLSGKKADTTNNSLAGLGALGGGIASILTALNNVGVFG